jgi:hypothetical protein
MDSPKGRVLLINPNRIKPVVYPLAFDYLGKALDDHGFAFDILDLCLQKKHEEAIRDCLNTSHYFAIGITFRNLDNSAFPGAEFFVPELQRVVQIVKNHSPQSQIILGGSGFSSASVDILKCCNLNLGVIGDGEIAFPALLNRLVDAQSALDIPGVIHLDALNGKSHFTPPAYMNQPRSLMEPVSESKRNLDLIQQYFKASGIAGVLTKRVW